LETVDVGCFVGVGGGGGSDELVPLLDEGFQVVVDVGLELGDGLGGEGMRDDFAFTCMFGSVAGVEESALDGDEGVVE
jgi:hypothetical protein